MPDIRIEHINYSYDTNPVLEDINFTIPSGDFLSIIGPNGAGKTTLLKLISRILTPSSGMLYIGDKALYEYSFNEIAKLISVVPQKETTIFPFAVQEIVLMGRSPHLRGFAFESKRDKEISRRAMTMTDIVHLAARPMSALSGGEQHRVTIARALAQQTPILILDEPNAHLDIQHQIGLFDLLQTLNRDRGITIICVSHDINLAAQYSSHVLLLSQGKILSIDTPAKVITKKNIEEVFNTPVEIDVSKKNSKPHLVLTPGVVKKDVAELMQPVPIDTSVRMTVSPPSSGVTIIRTILSVAFISEIFTFFYFTYIRNTNQGLSLHSFDILQTANLISLGLAGVLLTSILTHYRQAQHLDIRFAKLFLTISLLGIGFLLWNFYPDETIKVIAASGFFTLKTYQCGYSLLRHFNRSMTYPVHLKKSITFTIIVIAVMFAATSITTYFFKDDSYVLSRNPKADATIFFTSMDDISTKQDSTEWEEVSQVYPNAIAKNVVLVTGNHPSGFTSRKNFADQLRRLNISDSTLHHIEVGAFRFPAMKRIHDLISQHNWKEVIFISSSSIAPRLKEIAAFHNIHPKIITITYPQTTTQLILNRMRENILLMFFWMFGM